MKPRSTARFILQQTWPRREATTYNQVCTTRGKNKKTGMLQEIDATIAALSQDGRIPSSFQVAPTGSAFVKFAQLACQSILPSGDCAFDTSVNCPIWFGETGKASLYDEAIEEEGLHQSEEIGAWLSAIVLYGMIQSETPCYIPEAHLTAVMPLVSNLADIPSGRSIYNLISESARLALEERYGTVLECTSGNVVTPTPSLSSMPSSNPSPAPSSTPTDSIMPSSQPSLAPSGPTTNPDPTSATCGLRGLVCCSVGTPCTDGSSCKKNGTCR